MPNRGIAPPDLSTDVGKLRALIGDSSYVPLDPPEAGYGDYTNFSDDQLQAFLDAQGSVPGAAGLAYLTLASSYASQALEVVSDDLRVNLEARAREMRQIAALWLGLGEGASDRETVDFVDIVHPFPDSRWCKTWPEASMRPWGHWNW